MSKVVDRNYARLGLRGRAWGVQAPCHGASTVTTHSVCSLVCMLLQAHGFQTHDRQGPVTAHDACPHTSTALQAAYRCICGSSPLCHSALAYHQLFRCSNSGSGALKWHPAWTEKQDACMSSRDGQEGVARCSPCLCPEDSTACESVRT